MNKPPSQPLEVFGDAWAQALHDRLATDDAYRKAAARWEGALVLEIADAERADADRGVFLDLWHGECRQARPAADTDRDDALYVIQASESVWRQVLAGEIDPLFGLMSGKMKLVRGSVAALLPYAGAAKALVNAAASLDSRWP